jgi:GH18 family chitinase
MKVTLLLPILLLLQAMHSQCKFMAYVEVNSYSVKHAGCYEKASDNDNIFDVVSIFAANINGSSQNAPTIYSNSNVLTALSEAQTMKNRSKIKVLATILGNHQQTGWRCMTSNSAMATFATSVSNWVNANGLDGVDIDDEYFENCASTNNYSLTTTAGYIKAVLSPGKILTKALYSDTNDFNYQNGLLSGYLNYGAEMTYGATNYSNRIQKYIDAGMSADKLYIGISLNLPYDNKIAAWAKDYPGGKINLMFYGLKNTNANLLTQYYNDYHPSNPTTVLYNCP